MFLSTLDKYHTINIAYKILHNTVYSTKLLTVPNFFKLYTSLAVLHLSVAQTIETS